MSPQQAALTLISLLVRAPISGRLGNPSTDAGNLPEASGDAPLVVITQTLLMP
jgi:multidrug resistance efflux pump